MRYFSAIATISSFLVNLQAIPDDPEKTKLYRSMSNHLNACDDLDFRS